MKKEDEDENGEEKKGKFDPFQLDGTEYARLAAVSTKYDSSDAAQDIARAADMEMVNENPLMEDQAVQQAVERVWEFEDNLRKKRYPGGGCISDTYQEFVEGWALRLEVIVKILIDYLRAHPHLLK